ncbi:MAG: hypothetical protein PHH12_00685 [Candidatus Shapirobacteria bacterium]|nr:hypothetical protein [Candidatus Shapirobacteria bacterium]
MNKEEEKTNSGFIFGLTLGAAIGALSTILINKNNDKDIINNFESKVKDFFQDLISDIKTKKPEVIKKIEFVDIVKDEESQPIVIKKKPTPKMFVKPKR